MSLATYPKYESYKPTGVKWATKTPEHWNIKPVTAAAQVVSEANQPELELLSVYLGQGVVRFADVEAKRTNATSLDLSKYQVVRPGNLVLNNQQAWRGSVGVSAHTGIVSPAYIVLELSDDFDPVFADYYFQTSTTVSHFLVSSKGVGTIQRNLYWPALKRCPISIPPLPEQRAIAGFLDGKCEKIDEAVRIKEEQIKLLRERRQILIQNAVTRGLNPNAPLKDSGIDWIGQIPAHWEVKRLKHLLTERNERSDAGEEPLLMVSQVHGLVVRADFHSKAEVAASNVGNKLVYENDLVFNKLKAHLGVFFKSNIHHPGIVSPDYAVYTPSGLVRDSKFFELLFRHPAYIGQFIIRATGIVEGLIRLYTSELFNIPVAVAPIEEQAEIISYCRETTTKLENAVSIKQSQITALKEYKTSLINAAVTGKIKVF